MDLRGKAVVVTGATTGIGRETALGLAERGAEVAVVGRNRQKVDDTVAACQAAGGKAVGFVADLSLVREVRRLGQEVLARWDTLHVLVNNAGGINLSREVTSEGLELTFALNHLSYFVLTQALVPALARGARVVSVSSNAHRGARLDWDDLQSARGYQAFPAYARSKLMNILFTRELARRVKDQGISAFSLHPGVVATNFFAGKPHVFGLIGRALGLFMLSPKDGARTSLHCATADGLEAHSGAYFDDCQVARPRPQAEDDEAARTLWDVTLALLKTV